MLRQFADWHHRYVFSVYASILGKISDRIPITITDSVLFFFQFRLVMVAVLILGVLFPSLFFTLLPSTPVYIDLIMRGMLTVLLTFACIGILFNIPRTTYLNALEVTSIEYDTLEEIKFVISQLNKLSLPTETYEDQERKCIQAIRDFTVKMDGYDFYSVQKVKSSLFRKRLREHGQMSALYFSLFPELIILEEGRIDFIAHEAIHSRGHFIEKHVVFYTIVALITSKEKSLQFWGYFDWLRSLLSNYASEQKDKTISLSYEHVLQEEGLRPEFIDFYSQIEVNNFKNLKETLQKVQTFQQSKPSRWQIGKVLLLAFPLLIFLAIYYLNSFVMKIKGEQSSAEAYNIAPLKYLASYRRKHLT